MKRPVINGYGVLAGIIFCLIISVLYVAYDSKPTTAQDAAPAWEYAILVYGNDDARVHTGDTKTDNTLTGLLVPQDSNASNIALALNVMGADGWEMVDLIPGGSTLYMFKRPKD